MPKQVGFEGFDIIFFGIFGWVPKCLKILGIVGGSKYPKIPKHGLSSDVKIQPNPKRFGIS